MDSSAEKLMQSLREARRIADRMLRVQWLMAECQMRYRRGFKNRVILDHEATLYPWARHPVGPCVLVAKFSDN
jgi:hypothetical protein